MLIEKNYIINNSENNFNHTLKHFMYFTNNIITY